MAVATESRESTMTEHVGRYGVSRSGSLFLDSWFKSLPSRARALPFAVEMKGAAATCLAPLAVVMVGCDNPQSQSMSHPEESEPEELTIKTDEGTVTGHTTELEDFPQKIVPVNAAESHQFAEWAAETEEFLSAYGTPQSENELIRYDEAFKAWQDSETKKHSHQDVINTLGAYLGQRMVQDFDMEWVIVTDPYGQDYAVRHKTSELMSFPFSAVTKRIKDMEYDFIHGVYHVLKHEVENGE